MRPKAKERVHCFDAAIGKTLGTFSYDANYPDWAFADESGMGPTATPIVCDKRLYTLGYKSDLIRTIAQLRQWPMESLKLRFGSNGEHLWKLAHGIDDRPVVPEWDAKSRGLDGCSGQHDGNRDQPADFLASQTGFTCSARGPLGPRPSTKETLCPSYRASYCTPSRFDEWKKMSFPPPRSMNPNPLSVNFLIVPSDMTRPFVVEPLANCRLRNGADRPYHQFDEIYQNAIPSTTTRAWTSWKRWRTQGK